MLNRHFVNRDDILLLQGEEEQVEPEVRFKKSLSGRGELFPHIYGPLNIDAVTATIKPAKNLSGYFITTKELSAI